MHLITLIGNYTGHLSYLVHSNIYCYFGHFCTCQLFYLVILDKTASTVLSTVSEWVGVFMQTLKESPLNTPQIERTKYIHVVMNDVQCSCNSK